MWDENTLGTQVGDQPGDYPMPTNPQTPGAFGNVFNQITQSLNNSGLTGLLGDALSGRIGGQLGQLVTFGGLGALLNQIAGQQKQQPVGYQGGIPQYTATRQQLPYQTGEQNELLRLRQAAQDAMSTGATQDQVRGAALRTYGISPTQFDQAMRTEGTYRRPGQGGITYFTPMQYQATGQDLVRPSAGQITGPSVGSGGMELPPAFGLPDVGVEPKRRPMAAPSNIDMRSLGESAVNAIRGGQSLDSVIQTAEMKLGIPASTVRQAIAMQGGVASNLGMAEPPAVTGVPRGQRVAFGPEATVTGRDVIAEIRAAYDKAGLPQDRSQWTREHQRIATDINNQVQGFGPYERLIFDPNTGGVNRPDPQLFSTLEPERKAAAEAFIRTALPNAVGQLRRGEASIAPQAIQRLMKDYRLSLDEAASFLSPEDAAVLKKEIGSGNIRYLPPGRESYYGAIKATPISQATLSAFETLGKGTPERDAALRKLMNDMVVYQDSAYLNQVAPWDLRALGVPEFVDRYRPTVEQALASLNAPDSTKYWQSFVRDFAMRPYFLPTTERKIGSAGGLPINILTTPDNRSRPAIGTNYLSTDPERLIKELGFSPKDIVDVESALRGSGLAKPTVGGESNYINENVVRAVRESLAQGFTMDQIYEGAQKNLGLSRDRVAEALRSASINPTGKTDLSGADVIRMARENLPPPGAAAGGHMQGGIAMLSKGRYLKGNGDGVSDSIPARFVGSGQEARLADGEFVIPARVVAEIGNGSSDAGARKLYAMLDRVEARARKFKRGKPSGADRELNKLA